MNNLTKLFKDFLVVFGYILGIIGTAVTIFALPGSITLQINWLVFAVVLLIAAITMAVLATIKYIRISKNGTRFYITGYSYENGKDIYYTDYSKNLRVGTLVAFYYSRPMSKLLGYGVIRNSSVEEYIEIEVIHFEEGLQTIFEQSKTNSHKVLQDMYVLPNMYAEHLSNVLSYLSGGDY